MRIAVDITKSKLPLRFRKRVSFRNSKTRLESNGFPNYERWQILGLDVCLKWGSMLKP